MRKKLKVWLMLILAVTVLSGCNMRTVDEMYCLPKRSEEYNSLQSVIDKAMAGNEYSAPLTGEHQQTVQMADLDGDGTDEYILFAKGSAEKPLQIFIFAERDDTFVLLDTIESNGTAFVQVEYVALNDSPGYELVVGRQVSDQVLRSVSVYTMVSGQMENIMSTNYSKFLCYDLDSDELSELLILRPGMEDSDNGVAELYGFEDGNMERSAEANMSEPADRIKRIMVGRLDDGYPAVYVASEVDSSAIITDVYAIVDGQFTNVSFSNESGTSVQTLRSYYVYADDIDNDGVLELPSLITMKADTEQPQGQESQYLIRWYAMTSTGDEVNKLYTYHNFVGGWYMELSSDLASRFTVVQKGNGYEFSLWDKNFQTAQKLMTVYVLTGQKREEQAIADNRFVLYRSESTIYAANLEVASAVYGMSKDSLIESFHLILQDWKTGET